MIEKKSKIVLTPDDTGKHRISFTCTSSLYGVTDAGGYAEDALQSGFVSLGDGCDYRLTEEDIHRVKKLMKRKSHA